MSKKNHKTRMNHSCQKCGQHKSCQHHNSCHGNCHQKQAPSIFGSLRIEHLDIHLDERMYSTNHYTSFGSCDEEEEIIIDLHEMAQKISAETGVDEDTVFKVLMAEDVYLEKLGVCVAVTDDEEAEQEEPAESEAEDECDE